MSSAYFYIAIKSIKVFVYPTPTFHINFSSFRVRRKFEALLTDGQETAPTQGHKLPSSWFLLLSVFF